LLKFVGQLHNVINSILPSITVTLCWLVLAESKGEVSMAFVREILKDRKKESILFAVIMPLAKIVHSVVEDYCDVVRTGETRRTCTKACLNTTLLITNPI
jgi:hypothetical protein